MLGRPCYEIEFSDGTVIVADAEHQWLTETRASRKSAQAATVGYNRYKNQRTFAAIRTTAEIAATLRCNTADRRLNHSVVNARALDLPDRELLVPPYTLGAWLGDGTSAATRITAADPEIITRIEADGVVAVPLRSGRYSYQLRLPADAPIAPRTCVVCGRIRAPNHSGADMRPLVRRRCKSRHGGRSEPHLPTLRRPFDGLPSLSEPVTQL